MYEAAPHNLSLYSFSWKTMQDSKYSYIMQSAPPKLLFPSTQIMLISMYDMNHDIWKARKQLPPDVCDM